MDTIKMMLGMWAFLAVLGGGAFLIDKVDKWSRRNRSESPSERVATSKPALIVLIVFVLGVLAIGIHLNGGFAKTLREYNGMDDEFRWRY